MFIGRVKIDHSFKGHWTEEILFENLFLITCDVIDYTPKDIVNEN